MTPTVPRWFVDVVSLIGVPAAIHLAPHLSFRTCDVPDYPPTAPPGRLQPIVLQVDGRVLAQTVGRIEEIEGLAM
jgi:hypothetical protein